MSLLDQIGDAGFFQEKLIEPSDLGEHLQVGKVLRLKIFFGALRRLARIAEALPKFVIARIAADHVHGICLKKILQRKAPLVRSKVLGRFGSNVEEGIMRGSSDVVLNLSDQARNQIKILVDVRKLVQQLDHPVIILKRMQANPRQAVFASDQVFVERLMLVPKNDDAEGGHAGKLSLAWRCAG